MRALPQRKAYATHESAEKWDGKSPAECNDWGYKDASGIPLQVDGVYGPKTDAATKSFENNFFDGFTGGTNQKNTVQTKTFPTMPKASDDQIVSAVAPSSSTANMYDPLGQSYGYTTKSISQQPDNTLAASPQNLLKSLQDPKINGTQQAATLPIKTSLAPAETYAGSTVGNTAQNTDSTGQSSQSLQDMIAAMNKAVNAGTTANQDPGFTIGNNTTASQDPGFSARQSITEKLRPELKDPGFTLWNNADSGQDNGNATGSSTAVINKAFNDYNRNAGLDKSGFTAVSDKINNTDTDNPLYNIANGVGNAIKGTVKTIEAPVVNAIGNYLKDPKNADNIKAIQKQLSTNFQGVLKAFGMNYDEQTGQWYSDDKGIQKYGGYADFYDLLMPLMGFDLDTNKVEFNSGDKHYVFRPWFGCYGAYSLVPGGEDGFYEDNGAWYTKALGIDDAVPDDQKVGMDIQLYDRSGKLIMTTDDHGGKRYWQFGSNPMAGVQDKSNMYMEATLSSDKQGFLQALANEANSKGKIRFGKVDGPDKDGNYTVTYTYDPNGILNGGGVAGGGYGGGGGNAW